MFKRNAEASCGRQEAYDALSIIHSGIARLKVDEVTLSECPQLHHLYWSSLPASGSEIQVFSVCGKAVP